MKQHGNIDLAIEDTGDEKGVLTLPLESPMGEKEASDRNRPAPQEIPKHRGVLVFSTQKSGRNRNPSKFQRRCVENVRLALQH